jgi:hypothetical protein
MSDDLRLGSLCVRAPRCSAVPISYFFDGREENCRSDIAPATKEWRGLREWPAVFLAQARLGHEGATFAWGVGAKRLGLCKSIRKKFHMGASAHRGHRAYRRVLDRRRKEVLSSRSDSAPFRPR